MFLLFLFIIASLFLLVATITVLYQWNKLGKLSKSILSVLLFLIGIVYIRHVCSMPYRVDFSVDLVFLIVIGFIPILLACLITSKVLYTKLKTAERNIFVAVFFIILLILSFTGGHSSLYSLIIRIGQNGIVSDTEIVIKASIQDGITPEKAIEIADNYLRSPNEANDTYYGDIIEKRYKKATGTYIWDMYRDHWMKRVVVSTVSWNYIKNNPNIRWRLPRHTVVHENGMLYSVSFNGLTVYIDLNGEIIGTGIPIVPS